MAANCPPIRIQQFTNNGALAVGYKLYTYETGTTTNKTTYTDAGGTTPNANPIILDARGEAVVFLIAGDQYRFVLKTDADVTVWTQDGVSASVHTAGNGISITNGVIALASSTAGAGLTYTAGVLAVVAGNGSLTVAADNVVLNVGNANTWTALQTHSVGVNVGNSAQASATTLDWYQEGSFTPTAKGTTTAGTGTYTTQEGAYTRIGNRVFFTLALGWSAHTGTGTLQIADLPFAAGSSTAAVSVTYEGLTVGAGKQLSAYVTGSVIVLTADDVAGGATTNLAMDTVVTLLRIGGQYSV